MKRLFDNHKLKDEIYFCAYVYEATEKSICIWYNRRRSATRASIMLTFTAEMSLMSQGIILLSRSRGRFYGQASRLSTGKIRSEQFYSVL